MNRRFGLKWHRKAKRATDKLRLAQMKAEDRPQITQICTDEGREAEAIVWGRANALSKFG